MEFAINVGWFGFHRNESMTQSEIASMPLLWGGWIVRPTDRKVPLRSTVPNEPGIYAFYTKDGDMLYLGRSVAIATRLRQHGWGCTLTLPPAYVSYKLIPEVALEGMELAHIRALNPPENVSRAGGSTVLGDQVIAAIEQAWNGQSPGDSARLDMLYTKAMEDIAARL